MFVGSQLFGESCYADDGWVKSLVDSIFAEVNSIEAGAFTNRKPAISSLRRNLQRTYLSELSPESTVFQPFLGSQLNASLQQLYGPRLDRDLNGNPLRLWDPTVASGIREYQRGLAMQSRSELVYRLASKYQRFEASVGIDPDAASQADVDLRIYLDDRMVFERSISKADPVIRIDLDVSSANRMKLVVDYGRAMDIGDRLHLCDARLTK